MSKFKVGDRVVYRDFHFLGSEPEDCYGTVKKEGIWVYSEDWSAGDPKGWLPEWKLELADSGPVKIVTRRSVVPGRYGIVEVGPVSHGEIFLCLDEGHYQADELREAAHTLNQIAEALEDNQ